MTRLEQHNAEVQFMRESVTVEVLKLIMQVQSLTMEQAMELLYSSRTYKRLDNEKTKLYTQSPIYVFDILQEETESREGSEVGRK